jgi:hypothetical protein
MVHPCHTAHKSTGRQPTGQLAPRDVSPQPEPQPNTPQHVPQEEDSFKVVVMALAGEDSGSSTAAIE